MSIEKSPLMSKRLRYGSLWIVLGRALAMIVVFANLALLAKLLSAADFSAYVITISLVTLASVGAMFGLNNLICKLVAAYFGVNDHKNALSSVRQVFVLGLLSSIVVASFVAGGCYFVGEKWFHRPMLSEMWFWIGLWIALLAISQIIAETLRGLHNLLAASLLAGGVWRLGRQCVVLC